jgi:hypothetical protein
MNGNQAATFGVNSGYPSGCRLSRRSSDRQIEKSFGQIQKMNCAQDKLSGLSDEPSAQMDICAARTV